MIDECIIKRGYGRRRKLIEVKRLVCEGLSNDEISKQMEISPKTVKFHLSIIFKKEKVRSRTQLVIKAYEEMINLPRGCA